MKTLSFILALAFLVAPLFAADAPPAIDWERAKELFQREQRGGTLTADERSYLDEAKRQRTAGRPGAGGADGKPATPPAEANQTPLPELAGNYQGQDGGLYGGGKNEPPPAQQAAAARALAELRPLDAEGKPGADGKIVLLSIGMSNTTMEFSKFKQLADADPRKAPAVVIVDGAQGGQDAPAWTPADAAPWRVADQRLAAAGASARQVQVVWIKQAVKGPQAGFPAESDRLREAIGEIVRLAKQRYPNLRVAFLSSRIYAGYAVGRLNPEPYAYESAFAVRGLIQAQMKGDPALNADPARGAVQAPVLLWGPYLWANGATPRQGDGLAWKPEDYAKDFTHPGEVGRQKVAKLLLDFFTGDANAKPWFVAK